MEINEYGVCRLSVVSMRSEPGPLAPQVNQLLFGDHYTVLAHEGDWSRVRVYMDQSEGWIWQPHHHAITPEYFDHINKVDFKITTDLSSVLLYKKMPMSIVLGSIVPISSAELFAHDEQFAFAGESKSLGQQRDFDFLKTIAFKYVHAPYLAGGKTPFGVDAAGFVQMVFKLTGYPLRRTCAALLEQGKKVKSVAEATPGDVLFFSLGAEWHPAILLDNQRVIHQTDWVRVETLAPEGLAAEGNRPALHVAEVRRYLAGRK
ncbi:MAG: C40 family peptidase [Cyclobacteriaceae bacterium]|jgi:hypothetical protein|nr:C40 family peptidase [Cyclobacteriaceae bacterium]